MNTVKKVFLVALSFLLLVNTALALNLNILNVDSSSSKIVKINLDSKIDSEFDILDWDTKIFKDLDLESVSKDSMENNKITISLKEPLVQDTSYSFISVYGVEGNIDFTFRTEAIWLEFENPNSDENVEKILIKDDRNIDIIFKSQINAVDIEVKLLKEQKVNEMYLDLDTKESLKLLLADSLETNSNYILMMFALKTVEWDEIVFDNGLFDFTTPTTFVEPQAVEQEVTIMDDPALNQVEISESWAALDGEVEDVALNAAETPDTWAETWVLVLMTLFVTTGVFLRKRFAK